MLFGIKILSAPADELHDFVAITRVDAGLLPFGPRQNFEVPLDGDAPGIELQFAEQVRDRGVRARHAIFSIHGDGDGTFHF